MSMRITGTISMPYAILLVGVIVTLMNDERRPLYADEPTTADRPAIKKEHNPEPGYDVGDAGSDNLGFDRRHLEFDDRKKVLANESKTSNHLRIKESAEAPFVKVTDLNATEGESSFYSFVPRPGRFELNVTKGWTLKIPYSGKFNRADWRMANTQQVGAKPDSKTPDGREWSNWFPGRDPVIEIAGIEIAGGQSDLLFLVARRKGVATFRFVGQFHEGAEGNGTVAPSCELRVVVESDTSEIDQAIKEAVPLARIRVIEIRDTAALLVGTVPTEDDAMVIRQIGQHFYNDLIQQIKVTPAAVVPAALEELKTLLEKSTPKTLPAQDPSVVASETKTETHSDRSRHRDLIELKRIRDDVRSLRDEVRRLSDLIEKRQTAKLNEKPAEQAGNVSEPSADLLLPNDPRHVPVGPLQPKIDRPGASLSERDPVQSAPQYYPAVDASSLVQRQTLVFTAKWCRPCQEIAALIEMLERQGLPIRLVDVDDERALVREYEIESIPTFVLLADGKEIDRKTGKLSEAEVRAFCRPLPMSTRVYAVADLVIPLPGTEQGLSGQKQPTTANWLKLIDQITTTVEPLIWEVNGGPCTIQTFDTMLSLIIRAREETHESIAGLLSRMRKQHATQITVETWWPQNIDDAFLEKAGLKIEFDPKMAAAHLDESTAKRLIESFVGQVTFAPKITMFDGIIAHVAGHVRTPEGTEPDFRLNIRGTAVDDGRRIRLNVAVNPKNLVNELLSHSHFVPDGEYLLLDVTEQIQREKMDIPITGRMLVLVRARVVAEEEMLFDPTDLQQKAVPVNE